MNDKEIFAVYHAKAINWLIENGTINFFDKPQQLSANLCIGFRRSDWLPFFTYKESGVLFAINCIDPNFLTIDPYSSKITVYQIEGRGHKRNYLVREDKDGVGILINEFEKIGLYLSDNRDVVERINIKPKSGHQNKILPQIPPSGPHVIINKKADENDSGNKATSSNSNKKIEVLAEEIKDLAPKEYTSAEMLSAIDRALKAGKINTPKTKEERAETLEAIFDATKNIIAKGQCVCLSEKDNLFIGIDTIGTQYLEHKGKRHFFNLGDLKKQEANSNHEGVGQAKEANGNNLQKAFDVLALMPQITHNALLSSKEKPSPNNVINSTAQNIGHSSQSKTGCLIQ